MDKKDEQRPRRRGRPRKQIQKIPDTFDNVIKALVRPVGKKKRK